MDNPDKLEVQKGQNMPPRNQQGQQQTEFSPGILIADGASELVENQIAQLEGLGLDVTGISAIVRGIKRVGLDNPKVIGGLDVLIKTTIRMTVTNAPLREFLLEVVDAYWDKVKILSQDSSQDEVRRARGSGIEAAKAKIKNFLDKRNAKKPFFAIIDMLHPNEQLALFYYENALRQFGDPEDVERYEAMKPLIDGPDRIRKMLERPIEERIPYLEMCYRGKPGIVETIKDAAMRRETPWTRDAKHRAETAKLKAEEIAREQGAKAAELDRANKVSTNEKIVRAMVALLIVFAVIMILK